MITVNIIKVPQIIYIEKRFHTIKRIYSLFRVQTPLVMVTCYLEFAVVLCHLYSHQMYVCYRFHEKSKNTVLG